MIYNRCDDRPPYLSWTRLELQGDVDAEQNYSARSCTSRCRLSSLPTFEKEKRTRLT